MTEGEVSETPEETVEEGKKVPIAELTQEEMEAREEHMRRLRQEHPDTAEAIDRFWGRDNEDEPGETKDE